MMTGIRAAVLVVLASAGAGAAEPRVGDRVIIRISAEQKARMIAAGAPSDVPLFIAAPEELRYYRDAERSGPKAGIPVGADDETLTLPSGTELVLVPDRTRGVVLEVHAPDGISNDTIAYRVRLSSGPRAWHEVWVGPGKLQPAAEAEAASRKRVAKALERAGMPARAARVRAGR